MSDAKIVVTRFSTTYCEARLVGRSGPFGIGMNPERAVVALRQEIPGIPADCPVEIRDDPDLTR